MLSGIVLIGRPQLRTSHICPQLVFFRVTSDVLQILGSHWGFSSADPFVEVFGAICYVSSSSSSFLGDACYISAWRSTLISLLSSPDFLFFYDVRSLSRPMPSSSRLHLFLQPPFFSALGGGVPFLFYERHPLGDGGGGHRCFPFPQIRPTSSLSGSMVEILDVPHGCDLSPVSSHFSGLTAELFSNGSAAGHTGTAPRSWRLLLSRDPSCCRRFISAVVPTYLQYRRELLLTALGFFWRAAFRGRTCRPIPGDILRKPLCDPQICSILASRVVYGALFYYSPLPLFPFLFSFLTVSVIFFSWSLDIRTSSGMWRFFGSLLSHV